MAQNQQTMPGADRDEESGKYLKKYPDEDFLEAIEGQDGGVGTSVIAEAVGCSYQLAYARLQDLADEDRVAGRKIGNSLVWIRTDG